MSSRVSELVNSVGSEDICEDPLFFENCLTKEQLAKRLNVSVSFINKMMANHGLPYMKLGRAVRFKLSEIVAFLERRQRQ